MMMGLQIAGCAIFLLIAVFWAGKKLGQRRFFKIQEEMRILEQSFNHLLDDMDMVSKHNLQVLERSTEDLRELLNITDKKCLYANDLMKELDETALEIKRQGHSRLTTDVQIDSSADRKFRQETHLALEELIKKVMTIADRVGQLEEQPEQTIALDTIREMVTAEISNQLEQHLTDHVGSDVTAAEMAALADNELARDFEDFSARQMRQSSPEPELEVAPFDYSVKAPRPVRKTDFAPREEPRPRVSIPGLPVSEVLKMSENGVTNPQIARALNMGKGEIDLILRLYGTKKVRSVV